MITISLFLVSCKSEKPAPAVTEAPPPPPPPTSEGYAIEIVPAEATRKTMLQLKATGFDSAQARIEWLVNGMPFPAPNPLEFNASAAAKGATVQVRASVGDKKVLSQELRIKDSPPEIVRVKIVPEVFKPGDTLGVEVQTSDPDGDAVTMNYEWTKNGAPAGNAQRINGPVMRGDKVSVKITPFDGELYGAPAVITRELANLPPQIVDDRKFAFDGNLFTSQVRAADPDGDPLTYVLKSGPQGMTVDAATGSVLWNVPPSFAGRAQYTVSVADGKGGEGQMTFNLDIKK